MLYAFHAFLVAEIIELAVSHFFKFCHICSLLMDVIQNLFCMNLGLDLLWSEDLFDDAFFVDKIGGAEDSDGLSAAGYLLAPAAEFLQ